MTGACPSCHTVLYVSDFAETVHCPECRARFHPEHLQALPDKIRANAARPKDSRP